MVRIVKIGQNCQKLLRLLKIVKIIKNRQHCWKLSNCQNCRKIVKNCQNCKKLSKLSKIVKEIKSGSVSESVSDKVAYWAVRWQLKQFQIWFLLICNDLKCYHPTLCPVQSWKSGQDYLGYKLISMFLQ